MKNKLSMTVLLKEGTLMFFTIIEDSEFRTKLEQLYYDNRNLMFKIAYEILSNKEQAEDAVHESFIRIIKNLHKINLDNCPQTRNFLVIICRNVAINIYNHNKKTENVDYEVENIPSDDNFNPVDIVINNESLERLTFLIMELKPIYRDVFLLRYSHGFSREEIAEQLGITIEAVKKRITRAKKILVEKMKKEGARYE